MQDELQKAIDLYNQRYKTRFVISPLYALYPSSPDEYGFYDSWPNLNDSGVYVIFSAEMQIIYVGVAKTFGKRLYDHFHGSAGKCQPTENWSIEPHWLVTIPSPNDAKWERYSLEAYLIEYFNPCDNTRDRTNI